MGRANRSGAPGVWIETTRALAESNNSKLIIVGGKDGLPLILNTETGDAAGK